GGGKGGSSSAKGGGGGGGKGGGGSGFMKAPGGDGSYISRAGFESNPKGYFDGLHGGSKG
ncbi:glycine-rich RNA-binding protein 7-like protein, partial [Tanacetum coccineum]